MKLVVVVRKDLGMRCGKIAGQVGHASILAFLNMRLDEIDEWMEGGQKKIILKVSDETELLKIKKSADEKGLNVVKVHDFGLTQIEPDTLTCIGIGPDKDEKIDEVTKGLSLL